MRVTRKKALVIAEAACRAYDRDSGPGGLMVLAGDAGPDGPPRFLYVFRRDSSYVRIFMDGPFAGLPYHSSPASTGTWLGLTR